MSIVRGLFRRPPPPTEEEKKKPQNRAERRVPSHGPIEVLWFPDGQTAQTVRGTVEDYSASGMGLVLGCEFPAGAMVWLVKSPTEAVKAVVRHSERIEEDLWRVGVRLVHHERRRRDREAVRGKAELKWLGPGSRSLLLRVDVVDLSESGAGLSATVPAPVGQSVRLIGREFDCFGVIRHCVESAKDGYRIGLLFARPPHDRSREVTADWID